METKTADTLRIERSTTINRPIEEVYEFWHDFEPWFSKALAGHKAKRVAEIVQDDKDEIIVWRSLPQSEVTTEGSVSFREAPGGRGTEVRVVLRYEPPAGMSIAKLLGEAPDDQIRDDLRRFKQVMETGEVLVSEGHREGAGEPESQERAAKAS